MNVNLLLPLLLFLGVMVTRECRGRPQEDADLSAKTHRLPAERC